MKFAFLTPLLLLSVSLLIFPQTILAQEVSDVDESSHVLDSQIILKNHDYQVYTKENVATPDITVSLWNVYCNSSPQIGIPDDPIPLQIIHHYIVSTDKFQELGGIDDSVTVHLPFMGIAVCAWFGGSYGSFNTSDNQTYYYQINNIVDWTKFNYRVQDKLPSPHQQIKLGIDSNDILCNVGLRLAFKINSNIPACVNESTLYELSTRNWLDERSLENYW